MNYHGLLKELVVEREAINQAIRVLEPLARKNPRSGRPPGTTGIPWKRGKKPEKSSSPSTPDSPP